MKNLSDLVVSRLRTLVPKLYGLGVGVLLVWAGANAPWVLTLLDLLDLDLNDPAVVTAVSLFVVGVVEALWYEIWRRVEPRLPDRLTRLALGSAKVPTYSPTTADGVHALSADEQQLIRDLRATSQRE